jgi:hypothetical protein
VSGRSESWIKKPRKVEGSSYLAYTDKKENELFLIYREIQGGSGATLQSHI